MTPEHADDGRRLTRADVTAAAQTPPHVRRRYASHHVDPSHPWFTPCCLPPLPQATRSQPPDRRVRAVGLYAAAAAGITAGWAGAIWISQHIEPDPLLNELALFVHLAALVAGMGAELTLDWFGLRWLLGHHDRADVMRLAGGSHTLIWAGLAALTFSGIFLGPDVTAQLTVIKLVAVLVVVLNGLHAHALQHHLKAASSITPSLLLRAGDRGHGLLGRLVDPVVVGFINAR